MSSDNFRRKSKKHQGLNILMLEYLSSDIDVVNEGPTNDTMKGQL